MVLQPDATTSVRSPARSPNKNNFSVTIVCYEGIAVKHAYLNCALITLIPYCIGTLITIDPAILYSVFNIRSICVILQDVWTIIAR